MHKVSARTQAMSRLAALKVQAEMHLVVHGTQAYVLLFTIKPSIEHRVYQTTQQRINIHAEIGVCKRCWQGGAR